MPNSLLTIKPAKYLQLQPVSLTLPLSPSLRLCLSLVLHTPSFVYLLAQISSRIPLALFKAAFGILA